MCECLQRPDGTWHVDECCAHIMNDYHDGKLTVPEDVAALRAAANKLAKAVKKLIGLMDRSLPYRLGETREALAAYQKLKDKP